MPAWGSESDRNWSQNTARDEAFNLRGNGLSSGFQQALANCPLSSAEIAIFWQIQNKLFQKVDRCLCVREHIHFNGAVRITSRNPQFQQRDSISHARIAPPGHR
jgi:hypothetical protein